MPVKLFFCYAHEDEALLNKLKAHLRPLQRMGLIDVWYDREISAGTKWEEEIDKHLNEANIILLLVSPEFLGSDYCYGKEMLRALERDQRGEAHVIPIILRPVYWQDVLGTLQALPTGGKPIMSSSWQFQDEAWLDVEQGIRKVVRTLLSRETRPVPPVSPASSFTQTPTQTVLPSGQTTQAQQTLSPEEASIQPIQHPVSGGFVTAGSPVAEDEVDSEILRRIRNNAVPASWKVFRPAQKHLLWHSIAYYFHSDVGKVAPRITWWTAGVFFSLLCVTVVIESLIPVLVGCGILLVMGCVMGILAWRTATRSVLVVTPDRLLWGNWQKEYVERVFRYRDYAAINLQYSRLVGGSQLDSIVEYLVGIKEVPRMGVSVNVDTGAHSPIELGTEEKPDFAFDFPSLFELPRNLARTIAEGHKQFLRSNQGKPSPGS